MTRSPLKATPPNTITWGIRIFTYEFWGHTNIWSIMVSHYFHFSVHISSLKCFFNHPYNQRLPYKLYIVSISIASLVFSLRSFKIYTLLLSQSNHDFHPQNLDFTLLIIILVKICLESNVPPLLPLLPM